MTVNAASKVDHTDELIGLLENQSSLYTHRTELTEQQSRVIGSDFEDQAQPGEQLLKVLSQRQRVIDQLTNVHEQLAPYREHWSVIWSQMDD